MVRASALLSDYVLMDPGSNPISASFSLKMNINLFVIYNDIDHALKCLYTCNGPYLMSSSDKVY